MVRRTGLFVTFEGIEGSGKTVQIAALARRLRREGRTVVVTREPGGTRTGEAIRRLFLGPEAAGMTPWAEVFLVEAARAQHLAEVVRPALAEGRVVLCDRFTDSTLAYQGYGRGVPIEALRSLHRIRALGPRPDLTIVFDLPVAEGLGRVGRRRATSGGSFVRQARIDDEPASFHEKVRRGFLALARREPGRIALIPAAGPRGTISESVFRAVARRLPPIRPAAPKGGVRDRSRGV